MKIIEVVAYDPLWRYVFKTESKHIHAALGENVITIHHIGSTAIPTIYAKPAIDLLIEVGDITEVDRRNSKMETLGYEVMGEFGISGRRYFRKDDENGIRTHQIYAFENGSAELDRHIAFRDYMNAHPRDAQRYSELKRRLAEQHSQSIDEYMDGKRDGSEGGTMAFIAICLLADSSIIR